nr:hypothetical protein Iba_chr03cCG3010 [Ipomoea batatas]GMC75109.1 hypothetical protein Iba_chr03dCG1990 [Ipomoea batatas]
MIRVAELQLVCIFIINVTKILRFPNFDIFVLHTTRQNCTRISLLLETHLFCIRTSTILVTAIDTSQSM